MSEKHEISISSQETQKCPQCRQYVIYDEKTGDILCQQCGIVIGKIIDPGQEWTDYTEEDKKKKRRTGPTHGPLMTEVGKDYKDIYNMTKGEQRPTLVRLRKEQSKAIKQDPMYRNFKKAQEEADGIISRLELPSVLSKSFTQLYMKLQRLNYTRGRPTNKIVPALVLILCKLHKLPYKAQDIANETDISVKRLWKSFNDIQQVLNIKIKFIEYQHYISVFVNALNLPERVIPATIKLIEETKKNIEVDSTFLYMGKDPKGIAAAGIYGACALLCVHTGEESWFRTQKEIIEVAGISEPTLRKRWATIKRYTDYFNENENEQQ